MKNIPPSCIVAQEKLVQNCQHIKPGAAQLTGNDAKATRPEFGVQFSQI